MEPVQNHAPAASVTPENFTAAQRELLALYDSLDAQATPCDACGRCCRFAEMGFELWATRLEVETMTELGGPPPAAMAPDACPYLSAAGQCLNRRGRVLGCRIHACRLESDAMAQRSEAALAQLRQTHRRHGLAWDYGRVLDMILTC